MQEGIDVANCHPNLPLTMRTRINIVQRLDVVQNTVIVRTAHITATMAVNLSSVAAVQYQNVICMGKRVCSQLKSSSNVVSKAKRRLTGFPFAIQNKLLTTSPNLCHISRAEKMVPCRK